MPRQVTQTTRIVGAVPRRSAKTARSGAFKSVGAKVGAFKQSTKPQGSGQRSSARR